MQQSARVPAHAPGVAIGHGPGGAPSLALENREAAVVLDSAGLALWELCDGDTTPDEMIEAVLELYDAPVELVSADVHRLLDDLTKSGFLVWVSQQN